jgi:uncharacterized protein involved in exopolysaccharide biosynthesis
MTTGEPAPFVMDFGAAASQVRDAWGLVLATAVAGLLAGILIVIVVPPRFDGRAMLLVRTSSADPAAMVRNRIGPLAELMPGALGGATNDELNTELALLSSRATLGAAVDSLRLQVIMRSPSRVPPASVIDSVRTNGRFKPRRLNLTAGINAVPDGIVASRQAVSVKLLDREDAIDELDKRLNVTKSTGNAVEIRYRARDSVNAAIVPNLIATIYMARRTTVDRGLNQRRLEFLSAKADSVRADLRVSADVLARVAERSGSGADAEIAARALAEESGALQVRLSELRAAEMALDSLILAASGQRADARWFAGFPDLLRSPALNDLVGQIARVQTEHTILLGRVSATAPQAIALAQARDSLIGQLLPIATSYRSSLQHQRQSLDQDLGRVQAQIARLPAQAAAIAKEQAEVTRLAQLNAGMGMQVLEARLAAMLEGGDVRIVDAAVPPRRVAFPRPTLTVAIALALGTIVGVMLALLGIARAPATRIR